jgi:glutamate/tyrosine decarboxylase-like PLP-dependent enzyme
MHDLLHTTAKRALDYLDGLDARGVTPSPEALARLSELGGPLPDAPAEAAEVIALLDQVGSPATVASTGGRYYGFVVGGALPAALAANWLAAAWDQNAGMAVLSPVAAAIETITQSWLLDLLALPADSGVGFVTGATMANLSALAAARHVVLMRAGWDIESRGLFGAPPITVVVGDEVHVSVLKALRVLGLGRDQIVRVPVDGQGRMRPEALPALAGPTIICLQIGNVNSGACDPVDEVCAIAHDAGAWVHIDGAFGLWLAAAPARAHLVRGIADADSWATDAHKWLNVPYDCGLVICRRPEHLRAAMSVNAAYLEQQDARGEPYQYTPEMSRRARGVEVWAALRTLGRAGVADLIERSCRYATRFAEGLRAAGYQVLNEVVSNQVLVAFGDADTTRQVIAAIQAEGICWCGGTTWQGQAAMRISVSSWATTEEDVERSLAAMLRNAAKCGIANAS